MGDGEGFFCVILLVTAAVFGFAVFAAPQQPNEVPYEDFIPLNPEPEPNEIEYYMTNLNVAPAWSGWSLAYGAPPYICFEDSTVKAPSGANSLRLEPHTSADTNTGREVDTPWIHVHPGDHIVFRVYAKTGNHANPTIYTGARIGIDFYVSSVPAGYWGVVDAQPHGYYYTSGNWYSHGDANYVAGAWDTVNYQTFADVAVSDFKLPWSSNSSWTLLEWDITVPTKTYSQNFQAYAITPQQISGMIAFLDAREIGDEANAWFADPELYINPTDPIVEQVHTPTFVPISGTYGSTQNITISSLTSGATIYYTDDGSNPTAASTEYTAPVEVAASKTLKALGVKASYTDSAIGSAVYTIHNPPVASAAAVKAHLAMMRRR